MSKCWRVSAGPTFLVKGFQGFKYQNVVLLCLVAVILFLSKEFHGFVPHFQEFRYQKVFLGPVFLFARGFQGVHGLIYYINL